MPLPHDGIRGSLPPGVGSRVSSPNGNADGESELLVGLGRPRVERHRRTASWTPRVKGTGASCGGPEAGEDVKVGSLRRSKIKGTGPPSTRPSLS